MAASDGALDARPPRERRALWAELLALADDEYVLADRYAEWQVRGPTLEADVSTANVAQDELGHARLWYDLLRELGPDEAALVWERPPGEWRHATLVELPFDRGDWADYVVRGYCYDVAEQLRIEALADSSVPAIADRAAKVRAEEHYHREHAERWLERLADDADARERLQAALDRLFPRALALFEPVALPALAVDPDGDGDAAEPRALEADVVDLGVRPVPLAELRAEWLATVVPFLASLGLRAPVAADADPETVDALLPEETGRDGRHTDHWSRQYGTFTYTYRYLERTGAERLMPATEVQGRD